MKHSLPSGVFTAKKKNGDLYYRSTITYKTKHISLGSYPTEKQAHAAYIKAKELLYSSKKTSIEDYIPTSPLLFEKWVCLINFRDNNIYIKNPIYLKNGYFFYYFSINEYYIFDIDELFYYSEHKIIRRGERMFVSDYGMQINILARYGIKNYARCGIDYIFVNGSNYDLRSENIKLINCFIGVSKETKQHKVKYLVKLHIRSSYVVGRYDSEIDAAIAYNKAVDIVRKNGCKKNFQTNYIEQLPSSQYNDIYQKVTISKNILNLQF